MVWGFFIDEHHNVQDLMHSSHVGTSRPAAAAESHLAWLHTTRASKCFCYISCQVCRAEAILFYHRMKFLVGKEVDSAAVKEIHRYSTISHLTDISGHERAEWKRFLE